MTSSAFTAWYARLRAASMSATTSAKRPSSAPTIPVDRRRRRATVALSALFFVRVGLAPDVDFFLMMLARARDGQAPTALPPSQGPERLCDHDHQQLAVRTGLDAGKLILAAAGTS